MTRLRRAVLAIVSILMLGWGVQALAAWGTKQTATQLTNITGTEQFFGPKITMGLGEKAHVQIKCVHGIDEPLLIYFYSTLDTSSETWDLVASPGLFGIPANPVFLYPNSPDPVVSVVLSGPYKIRVGVKSGYGGTITSADMSYRIAAADLL